MNEALNVVVDKKVIFHTRGIKHYSICCESCFVASSAASPPPLEGGWCLHAFWRPSQ